jgi:hypothetical protein
MWDAIIGEPIRSHRVAQVMRSFETLTTRYEDLLPAGAGHIRLSTRQALGCVFGAPAVAALHAQAGSAPVDVFDRYWADVSLTWLEHLAERLHEWEDQPGMRRLKVEPYESWRREGDESWRAEQRSSQA